MNIIYIISLLLAAVVAVLTFLELIDAKMRKEYYEEYLTRKKSKINKDYKSNNTQE